MGILVVNLTAFSQPSDVYSFPNFSPLPLSLDDHIAWGVVRTFFFEKCISLLSMMFGISLFMVKDAQSIEGGKIIKRRLFYLGIFGLIHGMFIWWGDVLLLYAVAGALVLKALNMSVKALFIWGVILYGLGTVLFACMMQLGLVFEGFEADPKKIQDVISAYRGDFWTSLRENFADWSNLVLGSLSFLPITTGLMMTGLGLYKAGFFEPQNHKKLKLFFIICLPLALLAMGYYSLESIKHDLSPSALYGPLIWLSLAATPFIFMGYASVIVSLSSLYFMKIFEVFGRLSLSHYLCQSIFMTMLFYGGRFPQWLEPSWPFAPTPWFVEVSFSAQWPIVGGFLFAQFVVGALWLTFFRYGPFEALWRSLTLGRVVAWTYPKNRA